MDKSKEAGEEANGCRACPDWPARREDMVFKLCYQLDPAETKRASCESLAEATLTDLTVRLFGGDITIEAGEAVFDMHWRWIPVLDFALQMSDAVKSLKRVGRACVFFTEDPETICFVQSGPDVRVDASFSESAGYATSSELEVAVPRFVESVFGELSDRWPALHRNIVFQQMSEFIRSDDPRLADEVFR